MHQWHIDAEVRAEALPHSQVDQRAEIPARHAGVVGFSPEKFVARHRFIHRVGLEAEFPTIIGKQECAGSARDNKLVAKLVS